MEIPTLLISAGKSLKRIIYILALIIATVGCKPKQQASEVVKNYHFRYVPDGTLKNSQGMRLYSIEGKSVNMTSQGGGLGAKSGLYAFEVPVYADPIEWDSDGKPIKAMSGSDGKTYPVYQVKDGYITIKDKQYPIKLADGLYIIRKLTVNECKRLQTVPEWYEFPVSDTQAYKMLGNGWTVEVIAHLINATQSAEQEETPKLLWRF